MVNINKVLKRATQDLFEQTKLLFNKSS